MIQRKSLLFINQHYYPDVAATGQKLTDLAEYLAARGHDVHVLCSQGKYQKGTLQAPDRETWNGVTIRRAGSKSYGRSSHVRRLLDYAIFYAHALAQLLFGKPYHQVIVLTTPPLLSVAAALARLVRGQRYGIWSMDLHPDAEVALALMREDGLLARGIEKLSRFGYRHADFIAVLGPYMRERIARKGVAPERLFVLPMWDRKDLIFPLPQEENPLRRSLGLQGRFVVMYSGNAGLAHRFDELMEAMRTLRDHPEIFFLFAGDGPRKKEILAYVAKHAISNFRYIDYVPRAELARSLALADVHVLTLRTEMAGISVPCKLYGIMAAGRPTVMIGPYASEPADTLLRANAGLVIDPNDTSTNAVEDLVQSLLALCEWPAVRYENGARGRQAFLAWHDRDVVCRSWAQCIEEGVVATEEQPILSETLTYARRKTILPVIPRPPASIASHRLNPIRHDTSADE